jgi:hypothetical protein
VPTLLAMQPPRRGAEVVIATIIAWTIAAWLSMIALEAPWAWLKLIGLMTWVLLLLTAAGLVLLGSLSRPSAAAKAPRLAQKALA